MPTQTDPSFYQAAIGYVFGNTKVGVSWYQSQDFLMKGSKGTAIGIGVNHSPAEGSRRRSTPRCRTTM